DALGGAPLPREGPGVPPRLLVARDRDPVLDLALPRDALLPLRGHERADPPDERRPFAAHGRDRALPREGHRDRSAPLPPPVRPREPRHHDLGRIHPDRRPGALPGPASLAQKP